MRPKTKVQKEIVGFNIKNVTPAVQKWAYENCIPHEGYRTKTATKCLCCGTKFKGKSTGVSDKCPTCKRKLVITDTKRLLENYMIYISMFDICGRFQVNRYFQLRVVCKGGEAPNIWCSEVLQQWIDPNSKNNEVVAYNRAGMGIYQSDNWHGCLEIRDRSNLLYTKYDFHTKHHYPKEKIQAELIRNGCVEMIKKGYSPYTSMGIICKDPMSETLFKAKRIELLDRRIGQPEDVAKWWHAIKIVLRNNYKIKKDQTGEWFDLLRLLEYFGKDTHSPKFVCPVNLKKEHDKYVARKRVIDRIAADEARKLELMEDEIKYKQMKERFFGLVFTEGNITIKVLERVSDFIKEADTHRHCVYSKYYYHNVNNLCFSASVDGILMETMEFSLQYFEVRQSRGFQDKATKHHKKIIELLERNIPAIKDRMKSPRKKKQQKQANKSIAA